jgi:hypothetical protein
MTETRDLYVKINDEYVRVGEGEVTTTYTLATYAGGLGDVEEPQGARYCYYTCYPHFQRKCEHGKWWWRDTYLQTDWTPSAVDTGDIPESFTEVASEVLLPHGWEEHEGIPTDENTPEPPPNVSVLTDGFSRLPFLVRHPEGGWSWNTTTDPEDDDVDYGGLSWEYIARQGHELGVVK